MVMNKSKFIMISETNLKNFLEETQNKKRIINLVKIKHKIHLSLNIMKRKNILKI
jgi:hypothetical protein